MSYSGYRMTEDKPRFLPIKCPVCNSFGTLKNGTLVCHACKGLGYVVVDQETGLSVQDRQKDESEKEMLSL